MNMARDLSKFYFRGMNIMTQMESTDGHKSEWKTDTELTMVDEIETRNEIVRRWNRDGDEPTPKSWYGTLRFNVKFPAVTELKLGDVLRSSGNVLFCFAYAIPYVYTDLLADLQ